MTTIKKSNLVKLTLMSLALVAFVAACDDDDNGVGPTPEQTAIRVIHLSPDAPAVDVVVDGSVEVSDLAFGEPSGYTGVEPGTRSIEVTPTGDTATTVITTDLDVQENTSYTVFAIGELASIQAIVAEDNRSPNSTAAKVRFVHASSDAPSVDIRQNAGDGEIVFTDAAFGEVTDYVELDEGAYSFVVTPTGTNTEVAVFDPITVEDGGVYTVVAYGTVDNTDETPFTVRVFVDNNVGNTFADLSAGVAAVNVVHASPNAPAVNVFVDGMQANTTELTYPNSTDYLPIPAGDRTIAVTPTGSTTPVIESTVNFDRDKAYTVFAINNVASIEALVLEDEMTPPAEGQANVRFVHLSPNAPAVDVTTEDGNVLFGDYEFREASQFESLDAGTYNLQVRQAGTSTVVLTLPLTLEAGQTYTVFARGLVGGTGQQALGGEVQVNDPTAILE